MAGNLTKPEARVLINPSGAQLGAVNAILWGAREAIPCGRVSGATVDQERDARIWHMGAAEAERVVDSGSYLVLNAGRPYSLTLDASEIVGPLHR